LLSDNAIGGQNTTTYKYGNAKVNVKGRGNLGFGWIEMPKPLVMTFSLGVLYGFE
jgi:hypothetical protein